MDGPGDYNDIMLLFDPINNSTNLSFDECLFMFGLMWVKGYWMLPY
jgi:hypothetical protein